MSKSEMSDPEEIDALSRLQLRLDTLLPEPYLQAREDVRPAAMGSAELKFKRDGTVAWDEMWGSFCHLAMAGGPPHKGKLLEPGSPAEIRTNPGRYRQVVDEICRGITLVTGLYAELSARGEGWVRLACSGPGMAGWLVRAITMENVSVRQEGAALHLPAGAGYRVEKEIKNVITVIAKTCHYWADHLPRARQQSIADLFVEMELEAPLIQPALPGDGFQLDQHQALFSKMADAIRRATGLEVSDHRYHGWLGVECRSVPAAIWRMRALAGSNVLSRREDTVLFVPVNAATDPVGAVVMETLARIHGLAPHV